MKRFIGFQPDEGCDCRRPHGLPGQARQWRGVGTTRVQPIRPERPQIRL